MYAAGREHSHRAASVRAIALVVKGEIEAALDTEVLQEILHRYTALRRSREQDAVYEDARTIFSQVFPISAAVINQTFDLLREVPQLQASDAIMPRWSAPGAWRRSAPWIGIMTPCQGCAGSSPASSWHSQGTSSVEPVVSRPSRAR